MQRKKLMTVSLTVAGLAVLGWLLVPDETVVAVKGALGITPAPSSLPAPDGRKTFEEALFSWGKDTRTVINGHNVPPLPDPKINNSTVAGIDSDNDGIRDDVDRYIADQFGNEPELYAKVVLEQQALQRALVSPTHENGLKDFAEITCVVDYEAPGASVAKLHPLVLRIDKLTKFTVNTNARGGAYAAAMAGSLYGHCPRK